MQAKVYDIKGQEVGKIELSKEIFGQEENKALVHQVVVATLANARQGTKSTLTRSEVRGGGRKPWKQKGTGRARQGSIRSPQWIKGGVVFAPKPRDFSQKINKQMKKLAFISALSSTFSEKNLIVIDKLELATPKTKEMKEIVNNLKIDKKVVFVTESVNDNAVKSGKNIPGVSVMTADILSTFDVVNSDKIVVTTEAIKKIEEAYAR